jgi:hypothetical protein
MADLGAVHAFGRDRWKDPRSNAAKSGERAQIGPIPGESTQKPPESRRPKSSGPKPAKFEAAQSGRPNSRRPDPGGLIRPAKFEAA